MARPRKRTKRPPGYGSVFRLPNGRWRAQLPYYTFVEGVKVRRFRREDYETEAEAHEAADRIRLELKHGIVSTSQTVAELVEQWFRLTIAPKKLKAVTVAGYRDDLNRVMGAIGHLPITEVAHPYAIVIDEVLADLGTRVGALAVRRTAARLKAVFAEATRRHLIVRNPVDGVTLPRVPEHVPYAWTPDRFQRFLASVAGTTSYALYDLAVRTGLREGELFGLTEDHVDLETGRLVVEQAIDSYSRTVSTVKTRKSKRVIFLSPQACAVLRAHRVLIKRQQLAAGSSWKGPTPGYIFPSRVGTPLQANNMLKRFKRELTAAGFPADDIHFYHFRHFFRELAAERVAPHVVSDLMGHTDTKVTFEVYGRHVSDHAKREAATAMDDIWSQTG